MAMLPGMLTDSSDALYSTCVRTYAYVRHVCVFVCLGIYMSGGVEDGEEWRRVGHAPRRMHAPTSALLTISYTTSLVDTRWACSKAYALQLEALPPICMH